MATMTIAQAMASSATGIQVVDTTVNIAAAATNTSLISRVASFTMNANGASTVAQAKQLYSLGSKFSRGGYVYTVRDSVAALNDASAAAALAGLNPVLSVLDNATNLLAAVGSTVMSKATSTVLSVNATVSLANLLKLEALPSFSVLPGQVITLADTAANLLALTAGQNRGAIKAFQVTSNGTVSLAQAQTLSAQPGFAVVNNATLTVSNGVGIMTASSSQASIASLGSISGVTINVNDNFATLRTAVATLQTMSQSLARFSVTMLNDASATAAQIGQLLPLGNKFSVAGKTLTLTDTASNILAAAAGVTAMAQATKVSQSDTITADQLVSLTGLPQFSLASGVNLTVSGTVAALKALTPTQLGFVAAETVRDTITALTAATDMPTLATSIIAQLDAAQYTAAQAAQLGLLASRTALTITRVGQFATLTVADTLQNLATFAPMLTVLLSGHGAVLISPTNSGASLTVADTLSLMTLGSVDPAVYGVSVSDSGAAVAAHASELFGRGFASITVTTGVFAGTAVQLLDPSLHFTGATGPFSLPGQYGAPSGTASAQLASNATVAANQLIALSLLPGFSVATGVTLRVQDTAATLAANAALIDTLATAATVSDTAVVTAAQAAALAGIAQVVGGTNFSLGGHALTIADSVAAMTDPANAAGVDLASALTLASDAVATAAQAIQVIGFGNRFSLSGHALTLIDSAASLGSLAANNVQLAAVNAWGGQVLLAADVTQDVAGARTLKGFTGFSVGTHHLTISDTAANLLATGATAVVAVATAVRLSADATVSVAGANTLASLPSLGLGGHSLTVQDAPAALTGAAAGLALATAVVLADNTQPWIVSAATAAQLAMLPGFSAGLAGMAVVDTAANILAAPNAAGLSMAELVSLSADAVISAADAAHLAALTNFDGASASLTIQDRAGALASMPTAAVDLASSIVLQGGGIVSFAQFRTLRNLPNLTTDGGTLIVLDSADNLARLIGTDTTLANLIMLSSNASLNAADAEALALLPHFVGGGAQISVVDSAANLLQVTGTGTRPDNWDGELIATTVTLSTDATITAAQAAEFAMLGARFSRGNFALAVADTAANLLSPANAAGLGLATSVAVAASDTLSAAQASQLAGAAVTLGSGVTLTVQDTVGALINLSPAVLALATAERLAPGAVVTVTAQQVAKLAALPHFSNAGATITVSDTVANLTNPASAAGLALAANLTLASDAVATAAQAIQLVGFGAAFSLAGHMLTVIDSTTELATLAANGAQRAAVNAWGGQVLLSTDAAPSVAVVQMLQGLTGFSVGNHVLTITDTAANLLDSGATGALAIAGAVRLTADATISVANATTLAALHNYSNAGHTLTVTDTPAHLAAMGPAAAAIAGAETIVARSGGNAADFTLSAAQLSALMGMANLTPPASTITLSDTAEALLALAPSFVGVSMASLLGHVAVSLSADAAVTVANAMTLAAMPGFSAAGHALAIHDTPAALLTQAAHVAIGFASAVGIGGPATVSVATATALAALPHFAADAFALTIADTPANLVHMAPGVAAIATSIVVGASSGQPAGDYTLSTADFTALASLPNLSFAGFSGAITVLDTAANLGSLAAAMGTAALGSPLAIARSAANFALASDATVSVTGLAALASLPSLSLNGHSLTLQDMPAALTGTIAGLSLASTVVLSPNTSAWPVSAADAARLVMLPGFSVGTAGMAVVDSASAILASQNAAGLIPASSVKMNADATVSAADAMHLAGIAHFTLGTADLTIQDRAGALAGLSAPGAALASSIVLQGGGLVSVAQFTALIALQNLTTDGGTLIVVDTAANLATLSGASTTLANLIMLSSNATLNAADAEALALLPHFVGGGAQISVVDSAANLLHVTGAGTRPDNWDGELIATTVTLSTDATITAAQAAEFATLGARFSRGGHTLTVSDGWTSLVSPANGPGLALATSVKLGVTSYITAAQATQLANVAGLTLGSGVMLVVQDTVAGLLALSTNAQALATYERLLSGTVVTITAAQAAQLVALGHFTTNGSTITVSDTIANLTNVTGWQGAATSYVVADTLAHLVANAADPLLANATSVMPSSGGDIDAATAAILAGIPHFTAGGMPITVTDVPAQISANATAILTIGATARIDATLPIGTAQADALVALNTAGKLQTVAGITIIITDSYAALSDSAHAAGLALASGATVLDTPANILAAAAHNWGTLVMSYVLSAGGTVTAAQGATLAAPGMHLQLNGMALVMADTASAIAGAGATLSTLDIVANVTDTTANVVANIGALIARGDRLAQVTLTDSTPVTAAQADALQYLALVLSGSVAVNDTATAIGQNLPNLMALGGHLGSVTVTDSAAHVTPWVATLQGVGSLLTVSLTDTAPVSAAIAASLAPLLARLAGSTSLSVQDTGVAIAAQAVTLATFAGKLGVVTLSDGTVVTPDVAAGLSPVASHLAPGVQLDVSGTAAQLVANGSALGALSTAGRIHSLVAANDTASAIVGAAAALGTMGATATVRDSGTQVLAQLDNLQGLSNSILTSITLTDATPPMLSMSVGTLSADMGALGRITSPFTVAIVDTASAVAGGLATLVGFRSHISSITVSDGGAISLTTTEVAATGVNDGANSVLAKMTGGTLSITGAAIGDFVTLDALTVHATSISVSDTLANVGADLIAGSSKLLAHVASLGTVAISDTGPHTLQLTVSQLRADAGVLAKISGSFTVNISDSASQVQADLTGPNSILLSFGHLGQISFTDTGTPNLTLSVGQLTTCAPALGDIVTSYRVLVNDTASAVETDLGLGASSKILHLGATRGGIFVPTGSTIHLDASVMSVTGMASALTGMTGRTGLAVSNATVTQFSTIYGYGISGTTIAVNDTSTAIGGDLTGGTSQLELHLGAVSSITLTDGSPVFTLNLTQFNAASGVLGKVNTPYQVAVSDTLNAVKGDLALGGTSLILGPTVTSVTVPGGSIMTLTAAQATYTGVVAKLAGMVGLAGVTVAGATVDQFSALAGHGVTGLQVGITDTAAHLQADLTSVSSKLNTYSAAVSSIAVSDGGSANIALSLAQITAAAAELGSFTGTYHLTVSDDAATVQADLLAGGSSVILTNGHVNLVVLPAGSTITVPASVAVGGAATALVNATGLAHFIVTGVSVSQIPTILNTGVAHAELQVVDVASAVAGDLVLGATSKLLSNGANLTSITVSPSSTLTLTAGQVTYSGVADLIRTHITGVSGLTVNDATVTGVTGVAAIAGLNISSTTINVSDLAQNVQDDLMAVTPTLKANVLKLGTVTFTDGPTPTITLSLAKLVADSTVLSHLSAFTLAIADSAANIAQDLTSGSSLILGPPAISSVSLSGGDTTITLTDAQLTPALQAVVGSIGNLATVYVTETPVADVATVAGYTLGSTTVRINVSDTVAHLQSDLAGGTTLAAAGVKLNSVTLSNPGAAIALSVAQLTAGVGVLGKISTAYHVAITDTAANIAGDLANQGTSRLLGLGAHLQGVALSANADLTLDVTTATYTGVAALVNGIAVRDDVHSVIGRQNFVVTGVGIGQIGTVLGLAVSNTMLGISDSNSNVQADLMTAGAHLLASNIAAISSITMAGTAVSLSVAETGAGSAVLTKIGAGAVDLTISDSDTNVGADLALAVSGLSKILNNSADHITLSSGNAIALSQAQLAASGVSAAVASITGLTTLHVSATPVSQLGTVSGYSMPGITVDIDVYDTAAAIEANLQAGGSTLVAAKTANKLHAVTLSDATAQVIHLNVAQLQAGASVLGLIGTSPAYTVAVSDTGANILSELTSGTSLAGLGAHLGAVTFSDGTAGIMLSASRALASGIGAAVAAITNQNAFNVTGATVAQVSALAALGVSNTQIAVSDAVGAVLTDLTTGSHALASNIGVISTIAMTGGTAITLTVAQADAGSAVLTKIGDTNVDLTVSDTAANVQADLALAGGGTSKILNNHADHVSLSTADHVITLTSAQVQVTDVLNTLRLIANLDLIVSSVAMANIGTVLGYGLGSMTSIKVSVSGLLADVMTDLALGGSSVLLTNVAAISSITLTDSGTPSAGTLSLANLAAYGTVLAKIGSAYGMIVSDTAANLQADLTTDHRLAPFASHIASITGTAGGTVILTMAQFTAPDTGTVLGKVTSGYTLNISGSAADVKADLIDPASKLIAAQTANHLGASTVTVTGGPIVLSVSQVGDAATVLGSITGATVKISDSDAHIQADLALGGSSKILASLSSVSAIELTTGTAITLTGSQILATGVDNSGTSAIAKLIGGATLVATDVTVSQVTALTALGTTPAGSVQPSSLSIKDTASAITAGISTINGSSVTVTSVKTTETTLDAATAATIYSAFTTKFDASGLTVNDTAANLLSTNGTTPLTPIGAAHVTISNNPINLTAAEATTLLSILGGSVTSGHTITIADAAANLVAATTSVLNAATTVTLSAPATLTAANATLLAALPHFSTSGSALTVQDTSANLLASANANGILAATTTTLLGNETVNAATLTALSALHGYSAGATSLTVQDTAANIAALGATPLGYAATALVSDTAAGFTASVSGLQAAATANKLSVTLTDAANGSRAVTLTDTAYTANPSVYAAITNTGVIKVNGSASGLAAIASQLTTNAAVAEVNVTDSSGAILSRLSTLNSMGAKFHSATITDTSINAAGVASLLSIPNLGIQTSLTVTDTGAQIAAAIQANAGGLAFINSTGVSAVLSANSVVDAAGASTLSQITANHLTKGSYKIYIWDAASYLTNGGNTMALAFADGVYLKAPGNAAQVNAATATTLLTKLSVIDIDHPAPTGVMAASITVQDTAANLDASYANLHSNMSKITAFRVSAAATVSVAVLGELRTLGATMATGSLTARDTAAAILAELATPHGTSVTPVSWLLSASGNVTTASAVTLAGLSGFSAGSYRLTLSADATISVADANTLGTIRAALLMGGHTVHVTGSVTTVSGLSSDAKLIVTPDITDTFVNVSGLTTGSGLLGGTITISDTATATVTQAAAFLALIGGSGIPAASVAFASHIESVTDTLSNIQTLTGNAAWTGNAGIRAGFHLIVADTVANLINGSNTAALATMYATTLTGNSTVTAAAAESLFGLTTTINFVKGSSTLTIQDSAANLLNPVNTDALSIADTVQLSADDATNAADAETLLGTAHFNLNHVLTITDNSANLLDGVLGTAISSHGNSNVIVHLTGAETVDAGTARALVALQGFADPSHYLSIADSASYLINSANAPAEHLASSVTLTGDETVSIATAAKLNAVEHFSLGSKVLHLASDDYADQAGLKAMGDFGSHFDLNSHNVTVTQDGLALTPTEYANVLADNLTLANMNGHVMSAMLDGVVVTSPGGNNVTVTGTGVSGATLHVYADDGTNPGGTANNASGSVTVTVSESNIHNKAVVITETVNGVESAPIIAIEQNVVISAAGAATFATSGAVQVDINKFVDLYTKAAAPSGLANPILVYDPNAHTLSLNVNNTSTLLVTLGTTTTHPTVLTAAEIFIQHFS